MDFKLSMSEPEIDDFQAFWGIWPRREAKADAKRVWKRLSATKKEAIMIDIQTRYEGIQKCFIPYPATYLRGERWEDDPIPREEEKPLQPATYHPSHQEFERKEKVKPTEQETEAGLDFLANMRKGV